MFSSAKLKHQAQEHNQLQNEILKNAANRFIQEQAINLIGITIVTLFW